MRTRIIAIGAFICAAALFAVFAAALYLQARHVPCRWTADYCSPLDNLIFEGAVVRSCTVALIIVGLARGALIYWRWRLHETLHWSVILIEGVMLVLGIAVVWALSQAALDSFIAACLLGLPKNPARSSFFSTRWTERRVIFTSWEGR